MNAPSSPRSSCSPVSGAAWRMFSHTVATFVERVVLLGEVPELETVAGLQRPGIGRLDAGEQPQQRGLARAVEAEHDHARTPVDGQVDAGEHLQRPVVLGQALGHQRRAAARARAWGT